MDSGLQLKMIALNFIDPSDGCDLSLREVLGLLQVGLEPGQTISETDFPDDGRNELSGREEAGGARFAK